MTSREAALRRELDGLLAHSADPLLHDAVWAHLRGDLTRRELRATPAYQRVIGDYHRSRLAGLATSGLDPARLRAAARATLESDDARDGTAYAADLLTPSDPRSP